MKTFPPWLRMKNNGAFSAGSNCLQLNDQGNNKEARISII